ncbi:UDP-glucose 4-epimerase GalE [Neomicrococcus aestuarii]|uniref:UDP-glucose 4-epimerase n=1 Tax=Neomicrococcus aestuarii TaxID=556325 RepID=A0A1L2ZL17_9MICC|nr:UDP-glucose 4-epimerase GalE [Neomicrococcus aestuarii]APF39909.1 UDP-glucose 4-epimerase GalE [Neomicrococcus aestuarii]
MRILVTGGAGYIGSHTVLQLLTAGHVVCAVDNYVNSSPEALERVFELAVAATSAEPILEIAEIDINDATALDLVFADFKPEAVIHFAGLKAVGESVAQPLMYYRNNIMGTITLLEAMAKHGVKNLVFSSSATVYGDTKILPVAEDAPRSVTNPYGRTKLMIEEILEDLVVADPEWSIGVLRYFNPVGAHESGRIGEDPQGIPNNLMPFIAQVAVGRRDAVNVFGNDYPTVDGTGVRDYIHVMDLAQGHLQTVDYVVRNSGWRSWNLGTGEGISVLQLIDSYSKACGRELPVNITDRRPGDIASSYADVTRARTELGWSATKNVDDMTADSWRWQSANPQGYRES